MGVRRWSYAKRWAAVVASAAILLAVLRTVFYAKAAEVMDATFLVLLAAAAIALLVDWERVTSIKAGSVEVSLAQVEGALAALPPKVDIAELREDIARLQPLLPAVRGARVLWVEDHPATVRAERKLLRALGVVIVPATNTRDAVTRLREDADFDAIISDIRRQKDADWLEEQAGEGNGSAGVWFFRRRVRNDDRDAVLRDLPFFFYSALPADKAREMVKEAEGVRPPAVLCPEVRDLVFEVVHALWVARSRPPEGAVGKRAVYGSRWRGP